MNIQPITCYALKILVKSYKSEVIIYIVVITREERFHKYNFLSHYLRRADI